MNVGVVGLQEPRISVTSYTTKAYLLSGTQIPKQDRRVCRFEDLLRYEGLEITTIILGNYIFCAVF